MYYMNRLNKAAGPYDISRYSPEYIGAMGAQLADGIKNKVFLPHTWVVPHMVVR
jgi:hypothetical protein